MADLTESQTRQRLIDEQLVRAGWTGGQRKLIEEVALRAHVATEARANRFGEKTEFADYVLFDRSSRPIAVVEAKRTNRSPIEGERQAADYADRIRETHFNDLWKRQVVDVINDSLKETHAHVLISTHSSIALSDAFHKEIVRLVPGTEAPQLRPVAFPTFGTEPGRIMVNVFDAPDSIGSRALEALHEFLKNPPDDRPELERLVAAIGGGWPRAKLREILEKLDAPPST